MSEEEEKGKGQGEGAFFGRMPDTVGLCRISRFGGSRMIMVGNLIKNTRLEEGDRVFVALYSAEEDERWPPRRG